MQLRVWELKSTTCCQTGRLDPEKNSVAKRQSLCQMTAFILRSFVGELGYKSRRKEKKNKEKGKEEE
jgi:hypothetical protein